MKWWLVAVAVAGLADSARSFGVKVDAHEEECFHDDLQVRYAQLICTFKV